MKSSLRQQKTFSVCIFLSRWIQLRNRRKSFRGMVKVFLKTAIECNPWKHRQPQKLVLDQQERSKSSMFTFLDESKVTHRNQRNTYASCLAEEDLTQANRYNQRLQSSQAIHHANTVPVASVLIQQNQCGNFKQNRRLCTSVVQGDQRDLFLLQFIFCKCICSTSVVQL